MPQRRFGIAFVQQPSEPLRGTYVRLAERKGFESAWALETRLLRDGITSLASWASQTKTMKLGTAVVNPFTRTPTLLAQTFATLDEISENRAVLGIGAANPLLIESFHGTDFHRPLTRTKETIEVFRQLLRGETVDYEGATISVAGAQLDFTPQRDTIPVYMGVTGPKMLKLAGTIADGVILNDFVSAAYCKNAIELIQEGAAEAGRARPDIGAAPTFSLRTDGTVAKARVKPMLAEYVFNLPGLEQARRDVGDPFFDRDDVEEVVGPVREATKEDGIEAAADHIPDWVVEELVPVGTRDRCLAKLEEFFGYGLDFVIPTFTGGEVGFGIDSIAEYFELPSEGAPAAVES